MAQIPTAEEFLKEAQSNPSKGWTAHKLMIEFAKLHVEAALKDALESIPCLGSSSDIATYEEVEYEVLNSYPLENIK
jgi:hypothetical protein